MSPRQTRNSLGTLQSWTLAHSHVDWTMARKWMEMNGYFVLISIDYVKMIQNIASLSAKTCQNLSDDVLGCEPLPSFSSVALIYHYTYCRWRVFNATGQKPMVCLRFFFAEPSTGRLHTPADDLDLATTKFAMSIGFLWFLMVEYQLNPTMSINCLFNFWACQWSWPSGYSSLYSIQGLIWMIWLGQKVV